ncbi:DUF333 domain-containing protein [candidate division WWE3 bacterium]|uniref:DUF333 domain-containing protein n=1 Tax=candidate division WWE3 bacterium TaxID=2053526 RepID=A0A3A4ZBX9_UNCKA|nr:MAG: DUF333 domain-containing protein [candidate division WWE3 bacterium]
MKKYFTFIFIALIFLSVLLLPNPFKKELTDNNLTSVREEDTGLVTDSEADQIANMPNPAAKYCEDSEGILEIVTNKDGSQFGMCNFENYSCEEWAYFNKECDIESDAAKIKAALISKGLDLTGMQVVIHKHLGKYIGGGVVPASSSAGGGYFFAVKDGTDIKVLADGNGSIMCSAFDEYPDYPSYLVPECIDIAGNIVTR